MSLQPANVPPPSDTPRPSTPRSAARYHMRREDASQLWERLVTHAPQNTGCLTRTLKGGTHIFSGCLTPVLHWENTPGGNTETQRASSVWRTLWVPRGSPLKPSWALSPADCWPDPEANSPAFHRVAQHGRGEHQDPLGDGGGAGTVCCQGPLLQGRAPPGQGWAPRGGRRETVQAEWGQMTPRALGGAGLSRPASGVGVRAGQAGQ